MSIFRRRKTDRDTEAPSPDPTPEPGVATEPEAVADGSAAPAEPAEDPRATTGPYDVDQVDGPDGRLDLGSIWLPGAEGMQVRVEMDQTTGEVSAVHAVMGDSVLQLQAFAAPRSMGIWDEIRREIGESIRERGGTAEVVDGPFGTELRTRMPQAGPDGRTVYAPARFVGVDGPRWFLRGVFSGRAAIDESAAGVLSAVLRETVVVRGSDPMAPREMLPLRLPRQESDDEPSHGVRSARTAEDDGFNPLERGPEITEVR